MRYNKSSIWSSERKANIYTDEEEIIVRSSKREREREWKRVIEK